MRILYLPTQYSQQRQREKKRWIYPVRMAMEAEWYRKQGHTVHWGYNIPNVTVWKDGLDKIITEPENLPFLSLPHPDRVWTNEKDPKYQRNGNFRSHPGAYIMSASGCWWGKCSFCTEQNQKYEVRPVDDVILEIDECISQGYREIFDDSATFPAGRWLDDFLVKVRSRSCTLGCNCRLYDYPFAEMYRAGFRMVLFGLESANQETLNKINKGVNVEDYRYIIKAADSGLEPHVAVMFGYPWETEQDCVRTLKLVHYLLRKGYAKTAQASFFTQQGCSSVDDHRKFINRVYNVCYYPEFWFNQIKDIRNTDDIKYLWRKIKAALDDKRMYAGI